jgi:hypothetical protein
MTCMIHDLNAYLQIYGKKVIVDLGKRNSKHDRRWRSGLTKHTSSIKLATLGGWCIVSMMIEAIYPKQTRIYHKHTARNILVRRTSRINGEEKSYIHTLETMGRLERLSRTLDVHYGKICATPIYMILDNFLPFLCE